MSAGISPTYELGIGVATGNDYIKCLMCGRISYHSTDIKERFCAYCKVFHQDPHEPLPPVKPIEARRFYEDGHPYTEGQLYSPFYDHATSDKELLERFAELLEYAGNQGWQPSVVAGNLGYYGGYYNRDVQMRVYQLLQIEHPVFGMEEPTPEEAFKKGVEMATKSKEEAQKERLVAVANDLHKAVTDFIDEWNIDPSGSSGHLGKLAQKMDDARAAMEEAAAEAS
jgi:hypothetical protein